MSAALSGKSRTYKILLSVNLTSKEKTMRNLRTLCASVVLAFALTAPAFAGNISTMVTAPPPPPAPQGNMHTGVTNQETAEDEATASDSVTEIALNLLQSVLSLF